ncbi:MAG: hypothetical protein ACLFQB_05895 [Chitinispirillaceae bacterium]
MLKKLSFICCSMIITAAAFSGADAQYWESDDSTSDSSYDYDFGSDTGDSEDTGNTEDTGNSEESDSSADSYDTASDEPSEATASDYSSTSTGSHKICPVCIHPITRDDLYVNHNGTQINVCSGACIRRVKRSPGRFIEILNELGQ